MAIKSFKRYEKKYLLSTEQYDMLMPGLLKYMDADEHCRSGKNYSIYNIYYDTIQSDVIRHSISKPYYKEKLRLRSYQIPAGLNDKVFLELKKKIGGIVNKRRAVLTLGEAYEFLEEGRRPSCRDYLSCQVLDEIQYYLCKKQVKPSVYIGYSRKAFFGKDNRDFRLTLDSKILTRRYNLSLESGNYGKDILQQGQYLMEVKILGAMPLWFTSLLSGLSLYSTNFSKYGNEYMRYVEEQKKINDVRRIKQIC